MLTNTRVLQIVWIFAAVACNGDDGRTTYETPDCDEPAFDASRNDRNWAPCGCGSRYEEPPTEWEDFCAQDDDFVCRLGSRGGTCFRVCATDGECPPLEGRSAHCAIRSLFEQKGYCEVTCEDDNFCPSGMYCESSFCMWGFTPNESS